MSAWWSIAVSSFSPDTQEKKHEDCHRDRKQSWLGASIAIECARRGMGVADI